jgi:hypothetical protein
MYGVIGSAVERLKRSWSTELDDEAIRRACAEAGHAWRDRKLDPVTTVKLFLLQILWGNAACNQVPHLARRDVTGSAYCEARSRLKLEALQTLLSRSTTAMAECVRESGRWLGHRLFLVDGSNFSMPDTEQLRDRFGETPGQTTGCGFPTAHFLALVHFGSGLFQKVATSPWRTHDLSQVPQVHPELEPGDVLLGDRAFCSFAHLALLAARGVHGLFRLHQRVVADFTPGRPHVEPRGVKNSTTKGRPRSRWLRRLGDEDQLVEWFKPVNRPAWLSEADFAALPATLAVRELRYRVRRLGFRVREVTLATTLTDAEAYPAAALCEAYGLRWTIETSFAHLKTTMKMDVLRCQTVAGVWKELTMFLLAYNLVRMTIMAAARRQKVPPERISFVDALRWLATARPDEALPDLVVLPRRPNRYEPRARKRRPKEYDLLNKPRAVLRQALRNQSLVP